MKRTVVILLAASLLAAFTGCDDDVGGGTYSSSRRSGKSSRSSKSSVTEKLTEEDDFCYDADDDDYFSDRDTERFYGKGYSISADSSEWEEYSGSAYSAAADLVLMRIDDEGSSFATNINVIVDKLTKKIPDAEAYVDYTLECTKNSKQMQYKVHKKGRANGIKGYYMYFEESMYGYDLCGWQFICDNDGKIYVFTVTALENEIDSYEDEFREIMDTLEFDD